MGLDRGPTGGTVQAGPVEGPCLLLESWRLREMGAQGGIYLMQQTRCFVRRPRPSLTRPPAPTPAPARPPPPPPPPPAPPAPVSNDIAGILRRVQPRCQRYLCGSQSPASTRPHSSRRLWSSCAPGTLASLPPGGWRGRSRSCPRRRRARTAAAARSRGSCWTHRVVKKQRDKKKEGVC